MRLQLRAELYKLRTTRAVVGVLAAMVALVTLAVLLHCSGLSLGRLTSRGDQRAVFVDVGVNLGAVFAGLVGALSITSEIPAMPCARSSAWKRTRYGCSPGGSAGALAASRRC